LEKYVEVVVAYFNALFLCRPVRTEENYVTNPVRITGILADFLLLLVGWD
jgi:hypothetical protein